MTKLVVLRLEGDLSQEVQVTLEIGEEDSRPSIQIKGSLPPATDMIQVYDQWQDGYHRLGRATRITPGRKIIDGNITPEKCRQDAELVRSRLNEWLRSATFVPIWEKLLQQLHPDEEVRVLIRTNSEPLRRLPWQLWQLIEDYHKSEVALSATEYEQPAADNRPREAKKVKILAILGDSTGIDVDKDKQLLEKLPNADTKFLVEPQREEISDQLWEQRWDILCFAGHSRSEGETGRIYINETESLTIDELKRGLEKAVQNGLQLAIFNSCDGLGLARALQQLRIPQLIVMREPVPDQVAQRFLKYFLKAFSNGEKLYLAERAARQRLEDLENDFPCARLLPVMFQHPAVVPPTWNQWCARSSERSSSTAQDTGTPLTQPEFRNRQKLLKKVKDDVDSLLKQSLVDQALPINLHKERQPRQVEKPQVIRDKFSNQQPTQLLPNKEIIEFFEQEAKSKLLILGDSGSGKTMTLLELARELIHRAESDSDKPMPVLLNLSSWKDDNQTIAQWLVAELNSNYGVSKDIGNRWLNNQQLLPLLDGLDELKLERQALCIKAINRFEQDDQLQPLVVCSRREEYESCRTKLQLNEAICLQPLSRDQIQQYLEQAKQSQLWQIMKDDCGLLELAQSPLLLKMMTLASQKILPLEWQRFNSVEERVQYLLKLYISHALELDISQRWYASGKEPDPDQTQRWLSYLAKMLKQEGQTEFLIEKMQPHWLQTSAQKRLYRIGVGLITGLIVCLSAMLGFNLFEALVVGLSEHSILGPLEGLLGGLISAPNWWSWMSVGLQIGLLWAIIGGLWQGWNYRIIVDLILGGIYFVFICCIVYHNVSNLYNVVVLLMLGSLLSLTGEFIVGVGEKGRPVETLGWSWKNAQLYWRRIMLLIFWVVLVIDFLVGSRIYEENNLVNYVYNPVNNIMLVFQRLYVFLLDSLLIALVLGLPGAVIGGMVGSGIDIEKRTIPNQGIRHSGANAIIFALIGVLIYVLFFYLVYLMYFFNTSNHLNENISGSLSLLSLIFVSIPALIPGFACIQHFNLRAVLCWCRLIPWDYARFLNYAREKMLLQRVGGRYRFIHDLLREHFAQM